MKSSKVGVSAPTGKASMGPVTRKNHNVAQTTVNKVSSGKSTKMGTTMHKAGCTGTACGC